MIKLGKVFVRILCVLHPSFSNLSPYRVAAIFKIEHQAPVLVLVPGICAKEQQEQFLLNACRYGLYRIFIYIQIICFSQPNVKKNII